MNASTETEAAVPAEKRSRIGYLFCWAARLASLPVFALLLLSLVPALANFGVSPKDDKIIAVGLSGIAVGFIVGWLWAGVGGLLALGSVGLILTQEEGGMASDPFAVAFALQGILFLISWALNSSRKSADITPPRLLWLKWGAAGVLALLAIAGAAVILRGPAPIPVGREKEAYVGTWDNGSGFALEISAEGRAKVSQKKDAKVAPCNTPVVPGSSAEFLVEFRDDRIELSSGALGQTKIYHIDRWPFHQGKQIKMVLNGSDPYVRTNGIILFKKPPVQVDSQKPLAKAQTAPQPAK